MKIERIYLLVSVVAIGFLLPSIIPGVGIDYPYFFILVIVLFAWFLMKWDSVKVIKAKSTPPEIALALAGIIAIYAFNAYRGSRVGILDNLAIFMGAVLLTYGLRSLKQFWVPVAYGVVLLLGYQVENAIPNFVALQDWMASLMATWSRAFGITATASGHIITLNSGPQLLQLNVESDCTGIQGVLAFGTLSTMTLLDMKPRISRLIPVFLIGFLGVFLLNFVRLFAVVMTFEFLGIEAGTTAHLLVGYVLFIAWVLAFWWLALRYLFPPKFQNKSRPFESDLRPIAPEPTGVKLQALPHGESR